MKIEWRRIMDERFPYFAAIGYTACVYGTMAMMSIGAAAVVVAWLYGRRGSLREDLRWMRANPVFAPTLFFAVACLWSLLWAKLTGLTFEGYRPTITWDDTRKTWHLFFPFILAAVLVRLRPAQLRKVVKTWLYVGVASAILGMLQHYVPIYNPQVLPHIWDPSFTSEAGPLAFLRGHYHANGLAGFHLSYASIMAFPASVWLALMAVLYRREGMGRRFRQAGLVSLLFFMAALLTFSKIAWVAMPLTCLLIALIGFKGWPRYILFGVIGVFCVVWTGSNEFRARFASGGQTFEDHFAIWRANVEMIRQFPIFGVGWHRNSELSHAYYLSKGQTSFESHAHNNILDQWSSTGLLGLAGFIWLNFVLIRTPLRLYRENHDLLIRSLGLGLVAGWFCLQLNGLTQSNWWDAKVLHQIGWVTALTIVIAHQSRQSAPVRKKSGTRAKPARS